MRWRRMPPPRTFQMFSTSEPSRSSSDSRSRRSTAGGGPLKLVEILIQAGAILLGRAGPESPVACEMARSSRTSFWFRPLPIKASAEVLVVPFPPPPGDDPLPPPPLGLIRLVWSRSSMASVSAAMAGAPVSGVRGFRSHPPSRRPPVRGG